MVANSPPPPTQIKEYYGTHAYFGFYLQKISTEFDEV
jgi:hypothetical protein